MENIQFGVLGAGTASHYRFVSGSTKLIRLLAAPASQHC
jgi:hypothetical protein